MSIMTAMPQGAAVEGINPNLLDNWYFQNPVNQRGQSSYGAVGYTIDRWSIENSNPSLSIASNGVTFSSALVGGQFLQKIESYKLVNGKTYTLSALCTLTSGNATIKLAGVDSPYPDFGVATVTTGLSSVTFTLNRGSYSGPIKAFIRNNSANGSVIVHAFKLELGTEQTLAHQENGVWVLNEIPDYEEELYRCMTSTADPSDNYANKTLATGQELAYVENGATASRAYAIGEYFCWHGLLYRAKAVIGNGDPFTVNTNCYLVNVGDELNQRGELYCTSRYVMSSGTVVNHVPKEDCIFMILTYAVDHSGTHANGAYFGFISMRDARYSQYSTLFTPAGNPCSIAFDPGVIKITTTQNYVRVVVLEFPST